MQQNSWAINKNSCTFKRGPGLKSYWKRSEGCNSRLLSAEPSSPQGLAPLPAHQGGALLVGTVSSVSLGKNLTRSAELSARPRSQHCVHPTPETMDTDLRLAYQGKWAIIHYFPYLLAWKKGQLVSRVCFPGFLSVHTRGHWPHPVSLLPFALTYGFVLCSW